jgi:hypothetical protein
MVPPGSPLPQDHPITPNILEGLINELETFFHDPQRIVDTPTLLLVPGLMWMTVAVILGLLLHSTTKATIGSLGVFLAVNYAIMLNRDLLLFGLSMALIFPSIILGAVIGSRISRKIVGKRITHQIS